MPSREGKGGGEYKITPRKKEKRKEKRKEQTKEKIPEKREEANLVGRPRITFHPNAPYLFLLGAAVMYVHPYGCSGNCSKVQWSLRKLTMALAMCMVVVTCILSHGDKCFGARVFDGMVLLVFWGLVVTAAFAVLYGIYTAYMYAGMGVVLAVVLPVMIALTRYRQ